MLHVTQIWGHEWEKEEKYMTLKMSHPSCFKGNKLQNMTQIRGLRFSLIPVFHICLWSWGAVLLIFRFSYSSWNNYIQRRNLNNFTGYLIVISRAISISMKNWCGSHFYRSVFYMYTESNPYYKSYSPIKNVKSV